MEQTTTLSKFLILHLSDGESQPEVAALLIDLAAAVKKISAMTSKGTLGGYSEAIDSRNVHGEQQIKLDILANDAMISTCECGGQLAGMASQELQEAYAIPDQFVRGKYLLVFDPLDSSSNTDTNVSVGTIFSVLKFNDEGAPTAESYLQPGREQVAAGYALYGPATMLVISIGCGTHGFTLDREVGNFILTHPDIQIPRDTAEVAIDSANERFWEPPMQRYIRECKAGQTGVRQRDFNMRWIASRVADMHRILMRGGVFMYPKDTKIPAESGHLRLLYEANPMAMLVTQAAGLASTGRERIADVQPTDLHQCIPVIMGSAAEVGRVERYHADYDAGTDEEYVSPLFKERSLYHD